jgi:deoxyribodipyrimidine photo-lyase
MSAGKRLNVVWFRNDLRILDNPILYSVQELGKKGNCAPTLCLYCFDPRHFVQTRWGNAKTGPFRAKFLHEAVENLRKNLRDIGSNLLVVQDTPERAISCVLKTIQQTYSEVVVCVQGEVTYEELVVEQNVEHLLTGASSKLIRFNGTMLYNTDTFPFAGDLRDMPDTFTTFRRAIEQKSEFRPLYHKPTAGSITELTNNELNSLLDGFSMADISAGFDFLPSLHSLGVGEEQARLLGRHENAVLQFQGGEDAALQRLDDWMFQGDNLKSYFDIRNGMIGPDYSTKLSPYLSLGCISARFVASEAKRYENERHISNKSTYWIIFELLCREFFRCLCAKYGNGVFVRRGPVSYRHDKQKSGGKKKGTSDPVPDNWLAADSPTGILFSDAWKRGCTGVPIVDANMRELNQTGWMSNRGRQIVASYLLHELKVDWRVGADYFESLLIDHDVCSNYGNWVAAAGLTGGRLNRFNMEKQSKDYDPKGEYIKLWVPELAGMCVPDIFSPWKVPYAILNEHGVTLGENYPRLVEKSVSVSKSCGEISNKAKKKPEIYQSKITSFSKNSNPKKKACYTRITVTEKRSSENQLDQN